MTKEQLGFMFNEKINGFFIKKDVMITRNKVGGKKKYMLSYLLEDGKDVVFNNVDELYDYKLDGVKIGDILTPLTSLNIVNEFQEQQRKVICILNGGGGSSSGTEQSFKFSNASDGGGGKGGENIESNSHFPAEANVRITTKSYENALAYFSQQYANADHEYGYEVDSQGFIHQLVEGEAHSVGIWGTSKKNMILHNHPSGGNFSKDDMLSVANSKEGGIVAVGKEYTYTFKKNGSHFKSNAFVKAVARANPRGKDYNDAIDKWLTANQSKYGYSYSKTKTATKANVVSSRKNLSNKKSARISQLRSQQITAKNRARKATTSAQKKLYTTQAKQIGKELKALGAKQN